MLKLPTPEIAIFLSVLTIYLAASIIGILQLLADGGKYKRFLMPLVSLAVTLETILLIFRAVEIKAIPLTGLFESMIVLAIVFGVIYIFFSIAIQQVWFGSVMVWVILALNLMAGIVAEPASEPHVVATTPWAISHGIAMILGGASTTFATASAFLYLLGKHKLKQKKVVEVLGRVPNIEKLEKMNLFGIRSSFVFITIGLLSGLGLASFRYALLGISVTEWLTDGKVLCVVAAWILMGLILVLNRMFLCKGKVRAYITIAAFVLIVFAILGTTVFGVTIHDFSL
ncbi:MAG: cytochrome c biogenesis protein CcsA [Planctomycetota bacterium]|jgi:ABC-type uncharacterized transport system permease subunit